MNRSQSIQTLNAFLRGEIAAVATYRHALHRLERREREPHLRACMASHERRVQALRRQVRNLGGHPAETSGPWGAFARLVDDASLNIGDDDAISLLEEGEDHGLKVYLDEVCKLDPDTRRQIELDVLPEQIWTHDSLSELKLALHPAMSSFPAITGG
jgi:hypothetical protein